MEVLKVLLLAFILVALAFLGLGLRMLFKKGGRFPEIHVSGNRHLRDRGISCARSFDCYEQKKADEEIDFRKMKIDDRKKSAPSSGEKPPHT